MSIRPVRLSLVLSLIACAFLQGAASAQEKLKVPAVREVPAALIDPPRSMLEERHRRLKNSRRLFISRVEDFAARCLLRDSGSRDDRICPGEKDRIYADHSAHVAEVKAFNWDLEQAIGDYENKLEKRLKELDAGLGRDAQALRNMGFARRADTFDDWAKFSKEVHDKALGKLMDFLVDEGSDLAVKGLLERVRSSFSSRFGADQARKLLAEFKADGLENTNAAAYLRKVASGLSGSEMELANQLAVEYHKDLRKFRDAVVAGNAGDDLAAAEKLLKWALPPHIAKGVTVAELNLWVAADVLAQSYAVSEVARLTKFTEKDLKSLQVITCLVQKRLAEKHEVHVKLAALDDRTYDSPRPFMSGICRDR